MQPANVLDPAVRLWSDGVTTWHIAGGLDAIMVGKIRSFVTAKVKQVKSTSEHAAKAQKCIRGIALLSL
jgi:hypothetical protein